MADPAATPAANAQFSVSAYLQAHPDLVNNYVSDPGYEQFYGSLAKYVMADAGKNGTPEEQQLIQAGAVAPDTTQADTDLLPALGYTQQGGTVNQTNAPLEQVLLNGALPQITGLLQQDKNNQPIVAGLNQDALNAYNTTKATLSNATGGGFNGAAYFQAYPDVAAAYQAKGGQAGTGMTVDQFAQNHYLTSGQAEGRQPYYTQTGLQAQQNAAADAATTAQTKTAQDQATAQGAAVTTATGAATKANQTQSATQLAALQEAIASMSQSLTGNLAAKAAALQANIAALQQALGTATQAQLDALSQQIGTQQADLNASISQQQGALRTQIDTLQGANTTEAQQQKAALEQEINDLNAAAAPMAAARTAAAQLQVTGVNIGLQQAEQQINAQAARQGFVGGSTMTNNALAQAAINAQQAGAEQVGNANILNAQDTQAIANQGATGRNSITAQEAAQRAAITGQGAQGNYNLAAALAQGNQQLLDTGAAGKAAITAGAAKEGQGITSSGANQGLALTNTNADQNLALLNAAATGKQGIINTGSTQQYGIDTGDAAQRYNIATSLAENIAGAQNANTGLKLTNANNVFGESLAAGGALASLPGSLTTTLNSNNNFGTSGLTQAQNLLNWWGTNPSTPPTPGGVGVTASTAGNSISNLGSSILSGAVNVGNASKWWQTPSTTPGGSPSSTAGSIDPETGMANG